MDPSQDIPYSALAQRLLALLPGGATPRPVAPPHPFDSAPPSPNDLAPLASSSALPGSLVTPSFSSTPPPFAMAPFASPSPPSASGAPRAPLGPAVPSSSMGFPHRVDPRVEAALAKAGQRVTLREAGGAPALESGGGVPAASLSPDSRAPTSSLAPSSPASNRSPNLAVPASFGSAYPTPVPSTATAPAHYATDTPGSTANWPRFGEVAFPASHAAPGGGHSFDVEQIRREFPILRESIHGRPLVWFDNAATTQKPQCVIDSLVDFYQHANSNIHRAAHTLAARATEAYESARRKVRDFLGAGSDQEIVFVRGATEGINLVAQTYGRQFLQPGDEIVLTTLEHHANIVPWQIVARERGAVIRVAPVNDRGEIMLDEYQRLLGPRTRIVGLTQASNSLGTIPPIAEMIQMAKRHNARVLVDGAQSVAHLPVDVQTLGCDFFVFSGHKIFGPTGIGALFARREWLDVMPPWQGGGNMIRDVTFDETRYANPPAKFEAGTPNIADAVGLGAALDFVSRVGLAAIARHEHGLLEYATERLERIPGLRLVGTARDKVSVISFVLRDLPPEQIGQALDREGIAVRSGHHCAQPSLRRFGLEATVRPSFSLYNTRGEIDRMVDVLRRL